MPEGMRVEDLGKCDHAIRVPGATYEVGVVKTTTGYELRYDHWNAGGLLMPLGGPKAERLVQAYATETVKRSARKLRYRVLSEQKLPDGKVRLRLRV